MNAVARVVVTDNSFVVRGFSFNLGLPEFKVFILVVLLLISALGVVYVKDLNRLLFIKHHTLQVESEKLQSANIKLLLEQGAWGAQARVQMVAREQLEMQIPPSTDVMMIKSK